MRRTATVATTALLVSLVVAACSSAGSAPSDTASEAPSVAPSAAPSEAASVAPSPTTDACAPEALALKAAGALTVGADNPAYPPYFARRESGNTPPWEDSEFTGDPTTGEGFESAVAYAIADKLGIAADKRQLDRRSVRELVRAGCQGLRLLHRPGLVQA